MGRENKNGLWLESNGGTITVGLSRETLAGGKPKSIETLPVGSALKSGGPLLLVMVGKKEIEIDSPVNGKIIEVRPGLMTDVTGVAADPDNVWILKVATVGGTIDEDDDGDDDDVVIDDEDDDEDENPKKKAPAKKK